jgi:hypothetical protein
MAIPLSELQQMLDDLQRAKYSGQRSISLRTGDSITYGSVDDMQKAIADIQGEIAKQSPSAPSSFSLATYSRD